MAKRISRYLLLFIVVISILLIGFSSVEKISKDVKTIDKVEISSEDSDGKWATWQINHLTTHVKVQEDGIISVNETFDFLFNVEQAGVTRFIPTNMDVKVNGIGRTFVYDVCDIESNVEFTTAKAFNGVNVQFKNGDTLSGEQNITLSYKYNIGQDFYLGKDLFVFDILGGEWKAKVKAVDFTFEFPKNINDKNIQIRSVYQKENKDCVRYTISENTIVGNTTETLQKAQSLQLISTLPDGYFVGQGNSFSRNFIITFSLSIGLIAISVIIILIVNRKNHSVKTVEFLLPKEINNVEAGLIYKGDVSQKEVNALLLYFASHGYLKIEEISKGDAFHDCKITKLKDYDGSDVEEKEYFSELFNNGSEVYLSKLNSSKFPTTLYRLKEKYNSKEIKSKYFSNAIKPLKVILCVLAILSLIASTFVTFMAYPIFMAFHLMTITSFLVYFKTDFRKRKNKKNWKLIIFLSIVPMIAFVWSSVLFGMIFLFPILVAVGGAIYIAYYGKKLTLRTKLGRELYGKVAGFKEYLEKTEKNILQTICAENPENFYGILPYAISLEIPIPWINDVALKLSAYSGEGGVQNYLSVNSYDNLFDDISHLNENNSEQTDVVQTVNNWSQNLEDF
ncbi:MAG: DUF2207 domain-containing protein [Clostridiales bacterium]|nr:DUF2207 domain-containing protein [Clostridiales bacterium]